MAAVPPRKPRRTESHDDLTAVAVLDAAESRARAAMLLAEDEARRADALQEELATLRATQVPLTQVSPPLPPEKTISVSPQALTLRGHHWKIAIPFTLVLALGPLIWTGVSDYLELKSQLKKQTEAFVAAQARFETIEQKITEVSKSVSALRETVAELSGYLAGVLPKAGVKVPGTEPGAIPMTIISDPLPAGSKRQVSVTTHTLVPAPKPR